MSSNPSRKTSRSLAALASESARLYIEAEQSEPVRMARAADRALSNRVLSLTGKAKTVEELVSLEQSLQKLDLLKVKTEQDKKSILAAQKSYEQFTITLGQMRGNPDAYIVSNMGHKESGGDPKAIVRGNSLDFIEGNVTRMRNREAFAPDGEREVWAARIAVAKKTVDLFRALHTALADNFKGS